LSEIDWVALRAAATVAMRRAYAPYSRFPVGAAGLVDDGRVVSGCNVENASYGLTLCAECGVVSALAHSGGGRLVALSCVDGDGAPLMPCGRCRQLLWEHGGPHCLVDAQPAPVPMSALLPHAFDADELSERGRPAIPARLREHHGRGTVFVHPDMAGGQRIWTGYWERSSGTSGEPTGILEEAPNWPLVDDAVAWGRQRTTRVVVVDADGATYWAGEGAAPAGMPRWVP
jgi:cytidine deaminase